METPSDAASSQRPDVRPPLNKRRFAHLLRPLSPLLSIETGLPHPDFPATLLHYHLLTSEQLDELAHFYHQRTPGRYSSNYPMPVVDRWFAPPREEELEEGEIDEMEEIRKILGTEQGTRNRKVASIEDKRRRFGRFLGLRNCESSVGEGDMRSQMEEWVAVEMARREHRDREMESWRSKGHYW
ncbi:hypothetical protein N7G274_000352 [Stereocaulon virgatum]|uniref:Uncharacterized protein n=1 Tax=Stereocaulon virgatum TaxID=373712 RepID=A0ABR4ARX4_9LECA